MNLINISLDSLKEIVKKADEELGGTNGTVFILENNNGGSWGTKEHFYSQRLSSHDLAYESGLYYEMQHRYGQLISKKP